MTGREHGVAVLPRIYAGCIDGHEQVWSSRIDEALGDVAEASRDHRAWPVCWFGTEGVDSYDFCGGIDGGTVMIRALVFDVRDARDRS